MAMMTATEARKSFFKIIKQTNQQHEIIQVQKQVWQCRYYVCR